LKIGSHWESGLPDGLFSNQNSQFGKHFQGLRLKNVDIFYGHLEYFMDIWYILWPFGTFCVHLVHFTVLVSSAKKNLATLLRVLIYIMNDLKLKEIFLSKKQTFVQPSFKLSFQHALHSNIKLRKKVFLSFLRESTLWSAWNMNAIF
jgi:hypothetical protein